MTKPIGVGIIGMGFIGQTHARAVFAAQKRGLPAALRAVCDPNESRRIGNDQASGNLESNQTDSCLKYQTEASMYSSVQDILEDESIDLIMVCTPTDTHVDIASSALLAGKHVLVEKPVSTRIAEIDRLIETATKSSLLCVPAMCVRFWPGWSDLLQFIRDKPYGEIVHASFSRTGAAPAWSKQFYANPARCGNAIYDLHIHDADFALHAFGVPEQVRSLGSERHLTSQLLYDDGPAVTIEGGWLNDDSVPFRMAYRAEFERAVVSYDSLRSPMITLHTEGRSQSVELPEGTGFDIQFEQLIAVLTGDCSPSCLPSLIESKRVSEFIEAERRSLSSKQAVRL